MTEVRNFLKYSAKGCVQCGTHQNDLDIWSPSKQFAKNDQRKSLSIERSWTRILRDETMGTKVSSNVQICKDTTINNIGWLTFREVFDSV